MGIEPNEHQIPRFQGKYSYHTQLPENPTETQFSQCSPYVSVLLVCGLLRFSGFQIFYGKRQFSVR